MLKRSNLLLFLVSIVLVVPSVATAAVYGACNYGVNQSHNCTPSASSSAAADSSSGSSSPSATKSPKKATGQGGSADTTDTVVATTPTPGVSISPTPLALTFSSPTPSPTPAPIRNNQQNTWAILRIIIAGAVSIFAVGYIIGLIRKRRNEEER